MFLYQATLTTMRVTTNIALPQIGIINELSLLRNLWFYFRREIPINLPKLPSVNIPSLPRIPVRLHRSTARAPAQPQTAAHIDPGFANPLYDTSPFDDGNVSKLILKRN